MSVTVPEVIFQIPTSTLRWSCSGIGEGPVLTQDLDSWIDEMASTPPPSAAGEPFDMRVISIDVTAGMIASVKVVDLYGGVYCTDHLTLAMHEGRWVIVGKLFHYAS